MSQKIGRNDPCPCGSGKKYKQCCLQKGIANPRAKMKAQWLNKPAGPNLIERQFGDAIASTGKEFDVQNSEEEEKKS
jgi:uncharacterized protein